MVYIAVVYADFRNHTNVIILQSLLTWKEAPYLLVTEHHLRNGADLPFSWMLTHLPGNSTNRLKYNRYYAQATTSLSIELRISPEDKV